MHVELLSEKHPSKLHRNMSSSVVMGLSENICAGMPTETCIPRVITPCWIVILLQGRYRGLILQSLSTPKQTEIRQAQTRRKLKGSIFLSMTDLLVFRNDDWVLLLNFWILYMQRLVTKRIFDCLLTPLFRGGLCSVCWCEEKHAYMRLLSFSTADFKAIQTPTAALPMPNFLQRQTHHNQWWGICASH